jgi:hypothetical protein
MNPLFLKVSVDGPDIKSNIFKGSPPKQLYFWLGRALLILQFLQDTWMGARMPAYELSTFSLPIHFSTPCAFSVICSLTSDPSLSKDSFRVGNSLRSSSGMTEAKN